MVGGCGGEEEEGRRRGRRDKGAEDYEMRSAEHILPSPYETRALSSY